MVLRTVIPLKRNNMTKKINKSLLLAFSLTVVMLSACEKDIKDTQQMTNDFSNLTQVQFINAAVASTRNSIFVDAVPLNFATIAYGGQFPASPNSNFMVQPGLRNFQIRDTLATSLQPRLTFAENMQVNSYYTIFLYDTVTAAKQITVNTPIVVPDDTTARVRFAHFAYLPGGAPAIDIYSVKRGANVATNVGYTQVTQFIPYASALSDTLIVRQNGTPSLALDTLALNPTRKRSYTLVFRGRYRTNEANAAANPRVLSSYVNF